MLRDVLVDRVMHGLLSLGVGRPSEVPQPPVGRDQGAPFVQPPSRKLDQAVEGDGIVGFASQISHEHALSPLCKRTKAQQLCCPHLVIE
jgi:hypothetical protein